MHVTERRSHGNGLSHGSSVRDGPQLCALYARHPSSETESFVIIKRCPVSTPSLRVSVQLQFCISPAVAPVNTCRRYAKFRVEARRLRAFTAERLVSRDFAARRDVRLTEMDQNGDSKNNNPPACLRATSRPDRRPLRASLAFLIRLRCSPDVRRTNACEITRDRARPSAIPNSRMFVSLDTTSSPNPR